MFPRFSDPKSIVEALDRNVIGQQEAKKALALAVVNREVNFFHRYNEQKIYAGLDGLEKQTVLLVGKSGTGKTMLVDELSKILEVPFIVIDGSAITPSGWAGSNIENFLDELKHKIVEKLDEYRPIEKKLSYSNWDEAVSRSIVFIDECDKLVFNASQSEHKAYYEAKQNNLLKVIEGKTLTIYPKNSGSSYSISTKDMLFVLSGAFKGLDEVIRNEHLKNTHNIGFFSGYMPKNYNEVNKITRTNLVEYGLISEFVNRITSIVKMKPLQVSDYRKIMTEGTYSPVYQYQVYFGSQGVKLEFDDTLLDTIAKKAFERDDGARALKELFYDLLKDYMYNIKDYKGRIITISKLTADEEPSYKLEMSL